MNIGTFFHHDREQLLCLVYFAPAKIVAHKQGGGFLEPHYKSPGWPPGPPRSPRVLFSAAVPPKFRKSIFSPGASIKRSFSVFDVGPDEPSEQRFRSLEALIVAAHGRVPPLSLCRATSIAIFRLSATEVVFSRPTRLGVNPPEEDVTRHQFSLLVERCW